MACITGCVRNLFTIKMFFGESSTCRALSLLGYQVSCNIDLLTNIGTDCVGVSMEKALLVDGKRVHFFNAYAHDNEALKYGGAETRQRWKEANICSGVAFQVNTLMWKERTRDVMFPTSRLQVFTRLRSLDTWSRGPNRAVTQFFD